MKKFLIVILIIGLIAATYLLFIRYQIESNNKTVELAIDYRLLRKLNQLNLLADLERLGLSSIAIYEQSLADLMEKGIISYYKGRDIKLLANNFSQINSIEDQNTYILGKKEILDQLYTLLKNSLQPGKIIKKEDFLIVEGLKEMILEEPLYFAPEEISQIKGVGLNFIPRFSATNSISEFQEKLRDLPEFKQIIFSGNKVIGYPVKLEEVAESLKKKNIVVGIIENFIANQQGANQLGRLLGFSALRVHSIKQAELASLGIEKTVDRYLKAVRERNVRVLYLKPFNQKEDTVKFIKALVTKLKLSDYRLGSAKPFKLIKVNQYLKLIIGIASLALLAIVILTYFNHKLIEILVVLITIIFLVSYYLIRSFALQGMALVISNLLPTVIFIYLLEELREGMNLIEIYQLFLKAIALTLIGSIFLSSLLVDNSYLLQISSFRGIKLSFILPLLFSLLYYLCYKYQSLEELKLKLIEILNQPILKKEILLLIMILIGTTLYLSRTGNNPIIPVTTFELNVRALLENLLSVRPRFKSFAFGHPLLLIALYLSSYKKDYDYLLLLALVGPITIINTFSHLHTPIIISLTRVFLGITIAMVLGLLIILFLDYFFIKFFRGK